MQISTKAIVLSKLRYKDHDLIVKCYTEGFGIRSYLLRNVLKSKKGKLKPAYFQLFSMLEIEADHKDNRSLQYMRDVKIYSPTNSIQTDIIKSSIALFLAEILSSVCREEEQDRDLYQYLESSISWFEACEKYPNFHLIFLVELTKYLGFYPDLNEKSAYFNLLEGRSQDVNTGIYCISGENLTLLKQLLGIKFDDKKELKISSQQKRDFLDLILVYFKLHLDGFKEPKSLGVLQQVFS